MTHEAKLTTGSVPRHLATMAGPMLMGIFAMVAFNLADTWYLARLSTDALAAITFTFPVVIFVGSVAVGLGAGSVAAIARAIGQGDTERVNRLTTDSLILAVLVVLVFVTVGELTIDPLFRAQGADATLLPLIRTYMRIWYLGIPCVIIPMVGNYALRATGDMATPGAIMVLAALLNAALDPLLIFGLLGFPRLGIAGAAIATVLTRAVTLTLSLYVLGWRKRMLTRVVPRVAELLASWRTLLHVGLPEMGVQLLMPVTMFIVTRIVAEHGKAAVGAIGAGQRLEALALLPVLALSTVIIPFVAQNNGAGQPERVRLAHRLSNRFSMAWGLVGMVVLAAAAWPIARATSSDIEVQRRLVTLLRIVPLAIGAEGVVLIAANTFNGLHRPMSAARLTATRLLVLFVPLTLLGNYLGGLTGVLWGIAIANLLAGAVAAWSLRHVP